MLVNAHSIKIWDDKILGMGIRNKLERIPLHNWMTKNQLHSLLDISKWDVKGTQINWKSINLREGLKEKWEILKILLRRKTPINISYSDKRVWGEQNSELYSQGRVCTTKIIWNSDSSNLPWNSL